MSADLTQELRAAAASMRTGLGDSSPFQALLLGEAGSGKTALVDFLSGLEPMASECTLDSLHGFQQHCRGGPNGHTAEPLLRHAVIGGVDISFVDMPGYADTEGTADEMSEDAVHSRRLAGELRKVEHLNCVILVVNGTKLRPQTSIEHSLKVLVDHAGPDVLKRVVVVFTYVSSDKKCKYPVAAELDTQSQSFGRQRFMDIFPNVVYLENPAGRLTGLGEAQLQERFKEEVEGEDGEASEIRREVRTGVKAAVKLLKLFAEMHPIPVGNSGAGLKKKLAAGGLVIIAAGAFFGGFPEVAGGLAVRGVLAVGAAGAAAVVREHRHRQAAKAKSDGASSAKEVPSLRGEIPDPSDEAPMLRETEEGWTDLAAPGPEPRDKE